MDNIMTFITTIMTLTATPTTESKVNMNNNSVKVREICLIKEFSFIKVSNSSK